MTYDITRDMTYEEAVAYMSGLLLFGIRLDRERFVALLARLGDPHKALRCVHVAGTNGKGSTTTFIASILRAAGYRTGAYFSPYVFDLRERIQIDGAMIPQGDFARWVSRIRPEIEWIAAHTDLGETTEFELKTAVAFCYFAEQAVDFAVVEVGLGGRLDATNVIDAPLVAVITNIGMDHVNILGDTLAKIATEKAGILKPGTICVTAVAPGEARETISSIATERGVPLHLVTREDDSEVKSAFVTYRSVGMNHALVGDAEGEFDFPLGLWGGFQAANAAAAVAAAIVLRDARGIALSAAALRDGLASACLPGRFQEVRGGSNNATPALILDVAHNEDGSRVLADALRVAFPGARRHFVVGMTRTHDPLPFLQNLVPLIDRLTITAPNFRPKPTVEVLEAATELGLTAEIVEPARDAIAGAWNEAQAGEVVIVTGSFYTVGETPEDLRDSLTPGYPPGAPLSQTREGVRQAAT